MIKFDNSSFARQREFLCKNLPNGDWFVSNWRGYNPLAPRLARLRNVPQVSSPLLSMDKGSPNPFQGTPWLKNNTQKVELKTTVHGQLRAVVNLQSC